MLVVVYMGSGRAESPVPTAGAGRHALFRLPSVVGYAGMCACGAETPAPDYDSLDELGAALSPHLEANGALPQVDEEALVREAGRFMLGDLLGYHRRIETTEQGIRHVGWVVAGSRGSILVPPDGYGRFLGTWSRFTTSQQEG